MKIQPLYLSVLQLSAVGILIGGSLSLLPIAAQASEQSNQISAQSLMAQSSSAAELGIPAGWQDVRSPEGDFTISMPNQPKPDTSRQGIRRWELDQDKSKYFIQSIDLPNLKQATRAEVLAILTQIPQAYVRGAAAQLGSQRSIVLNSYPGQEFEFQLRNGWKGRGRVYIVGERVYQIVAIAETTQTFAPFLQSFKLIGLGQ